MADGRGSRQPDRERGQKKRRPSGESAGPPKFMDVQIRSGLDNHHVRLPTRHFQVLVNYWMLGEESVILRCAYQAMETNIILRGTTGGHVSVTVANPDRKLPTYNVFRVVDLRKDWLTENGL